MTAGIVAYLRFLNTSKGYPHPEGGTLTLACGYHADVAMTSVGEGLTDGEAQTSALYEIIDLIETLEDLRLCLFGDTFASVLTIDVQALALLALNGSGLLTVANLDMPLMGVFHSVGDEVGDDLRQAFGIDLDRKGVVRIVFQELYGWILHPGAQRLEQLVEGLGEIDLEGFDVHVSARQ